MNNITRMDDSRLIRLAFEQGRQFCEENAQRWRQNDWHESEGFRAAMERYWRQSAARITELSRGDSA